MHINELKESRFLKKEDCGPSGILVTIKEIVQENVAKEGAPEELKWCIILNEADKPFVLNSINAQLIASIAKSEETDQWAGTKIVLYNDPTVNFAGKVTGGIRVRAPRGKVAQQFTAQPRKPVMLPPEPVAAPQEDPDEDPNVPF